MTAATFMTMMTFFGPVGPWCGPGPACRGIADQLGHPVIVVQQRQVDEQQGGAGGGGVAPALLRAHPSVPILAKIVQPAQHMEEAHAQPQQGPTAPVQDLWTQLHPVGQPERAHEDCPRSAGARRGTSRCWGSSGMLPTSQVLHLQEALHYQQQHVPTHQSEHIIKSPKIYLYFLLFRLFMFTTCLKLLPPPHHQPCWSPGPRGR